MEIDVAGMACRLPGAADLRGFWNLLVNAEHGIREVPPDRWPSDQFTASPIQPGKTNTRYAGFIDAPDRFDYAFFGMSPKEAAATDIQQRLVLQATYHAFEDAGLDPRRLRGSSTGVFVGLMSSDWGALHLNDYAGMTPQRGVGNGYCMVANRVSYALDLLGPSMSVDTACSSSLTAVHLAANALDSGECDLAVVAGVNLMLSPALSIFYAQAGLSAEDGRCRPFSASGGGIGRGEGVGVVVLRRSADRPSGSPPPYASIRGSHVCQDGRSNGITAPTRRGQEQAISRALTSAGIGGSAVDFVEAHGTGTALGDMIETQALGAVCGQRAGRSPLLIGSVKGNIGHAEGAAGIAGFIKACLAIHHRVLPPSLLGDGAGPALDVARHGLRIATSAQKLPANDVLGGVSSFGMGGTNCHVVIGSIHRRRRPANTDGIGVLTVSGNDPQAAERNLSVLTNGCGSGDHWGRYCYSTNAVKSAGVHRAALVARTADDAQGGATFARRRLAPQVVDLRQPRRPKVAFVFTGQGSQYRGMAVALANDVPIFAQAMERIDQRLTPAFGGSIREAIEKGRDHRGRSLDHTAVAQPALFATQVALAEVLAAHGVQPEAVLGHSVGEIAACVTAGILSEASAAELVVRRGELMGALPPGGSMLSVQLGADRASEFCDEHVVLAAENGPQNVVLSGPADRIDKTAARLEIQGIKTQPLVVSHAFHSPAMAPAADGLGSAAPSPLVSSADAPTLVSTVDGAITTAGAVTGDYWRRQLLSTVRFHRAVGKLAELAPTHVVEIGPRATLLGLISAASSVPGALLTAPIPGAAATGRDYAEALAELWLSGVEVDFGPMYAEANRVTTRIPDYVFADDERFFASAATANTHRAISTVASNIPADASAERSAPRVIRNGSAIRIAVLRVLSDVSGHRVDALHSGADLRDELGFDSVQAMQFADRIAVELEIPPIDPVAMTDNLKTVADLTQLVASISAKRAGA